MLHRLYSRRELQQVEQKYLAVAVERWLSRAVSDHQVARYTMYGRQLPVLVDFAARQSGAKTPCFTPAAAFYQIAFRSDAALRNSSVFQGKGLEVVWIL